MHQYIIYITVPAPSLPRLLLSSSRSLLLYLIYTGLGTVYQAPCRYILIYGALFFGRAGAVPISVPRWTGRAPGAIRSTCRPRWALGRPRGGHPAPAGPLPLATALLRPAGRPCRASAPPQRSMPPQRLSGARSTPAAPEAAHNRLAGENRGTRGTLRPRPQPQSGTGHAGTPQMAPESPSTPWQATRHRSDRPGATGHPTEPQQRPDPYSIPIQSDPIPEPTIRQRQNTGTKRAGSVAQGRSHTEFPYFLLYFSYGFSV